MKITDEKLLTLCDKFGKRALLWRRKFTGLLPEVNHRRLFERRGCSSIFEFAAKLAGLSEEQVRRALNLEMSFADKPALHALLVEGKVSINKLARVAALATPENEAELAGLVRVLPQAALETLARDERLNGFPEPLFEAKSVRAHDLNLSESTTKRLLELQEKGIDVDALLAQFLDAREEAIANQKAALSGHQATSRKAPVAIVRLLKEEHGTKCAVPTCTHPSVELHHAQRFSIANSHDPNYLAPLCKEHHQLAHAVDLRVQKHWR